MKSSCVAHTPDTPLVIIRKDYLELCDGNHCAAAILNIFEYWLNVMQPASEQGAIENEIAAAGDQQGHGHTERWVWKTHSQLQEELLGAFGLSKITASASWLVEHKYLKRRRNPKYRWDRTYQYLLNLKPLNQVLQGLKSTNHKGQNQAINDGKANETIPEVTLEVKKEINYMGGSKDPPQKKPKKKPNSINKHAAVQAYRSVTHRYPSTDVWKRHVVLSVGCKEEKLERWRKVVEAWCGMGWSPMNVKGMLECFTKNEMPGENQRGRAKSKQINPLSMTEAESHEYWDKVKEEDEANAAKEAAEREELRASIQKAKRKIALAQQRKASENREGVAGSQEI